MKKKIWIASVCILVLLVCIICVAAISDGFHWPFSTAQDDCDHDYTMLVSVEATCTTHGEMTYFCNKCGYSMSAPYEAFGHSVKDGVCVLCGKEANTSENLEYQYSASLGGYIVMGPGACTDTNISISDTHMEKPVVMIAEKAFLGNQTIESIEIPESVTIIENEAFAECPNLTSVVFLSSAEGESSLERIETKAFYNCRNLSGLVLPGNLAYIGEEAFKNCINIATTLVIPDSVKEIGKAAFFACYYIETLKIRSGVTQIAEDTFFCCDGVKKLILSNALTSVGGWAFCSPSKIEAVHFGGTETEWDAIAFGHNVWGESEEYAPTTVIYNSQG